jgi:hypothetical protein
MGDDRPVWCVQEWKDGVGRVRTKTLVVSAETKIRDKMGPRRTKNKTHERKEIEISIKEGRSSFLRR